MANNFKYFLNPKELKEARKYIIEDIKSNNKVMNPIENMTLQDYFDIIKEFMLSFIDENGVVLDMFGKTWWSESKKADIRPLPSVEVAKSWMDGRGLFTEHFNGQLWGVDKHCGNWENIKQHEQNQWYHEDRLNDPQWFKECNLCIGHGGHPTETLMAGNFNPYEYEENKWCVCFGSFSRSDYGCLKGYLHLKKKGLPVFIYAAQNYLTPTQRQKLIEEGYLDDYNYLTGYFSYRGINMYIATDEDGKTVCCGTSKGQVVRILIQMGLEWEKYKITYIQGVKA